MKAASTWGGTRGSPPGSSASRRCRATFRSTPSLCDVVVRLSSHTRYTISATLAFMATKPAAKRRVATPWGSAEVVEEVKVAQRASEKRFATIVQLLAGADDEAYVRIAYSTDGVARRGPVTLKLRDL